MIFTAAPMPGGPPSMPLARGMGAQAEATGVCDHRKSRDHLLSFAFCLPMQERGAERFQLELDDRSAHQLLNDYQERYPALRVEHGGVSAGGLECLHLAGRSRGPR